MSSAKNATTPSPSPRKSATTFTSAPESGGAGRTVRGCGMRCHRSLLRGFPRTVGRASARWPRPVPHTVPAGFPQGSRPRGSAPGARPARRSRSAPDTSTRPTVAARNASGRSSARRPSRASRRPRSRARPAGGSENAATNANAGTASSGCGRLEKMLQPAACEHADAPRHEHEADRESLGDVVDGDRQRAWRARATASSANDDADADPLGDRVDGHHADDQERLARVGGAERLEADVRPAGDGPGQERGERKPEEEPGRRAPAAGGDALPEEQTARRDHAPGRSCVRDADRRARETRRERKRNGAEPRRERGHERGETHEEQVERVGGAHGITPFWSEKHRGRPEPPSAGGTS